MFEFGVARTCSNCDSAFTDDEQVVEYSTCGSRAVSITAEAAVTVIPSVDIALSYGPNPGWRQQWDRRGQA